MQTLILKKTDKGLEALRARDPALPPRMRTAFILFDGNKSVEQVIELLPGNTGRLQLLEDIKLLIQQGLLELLRPAQAGEVGGWLNHPSETPGAAHEPVAPASAAPPPSLAEERQQAARHTIAPAQVSDPTDRYMKAYPVASQLVSELGLKGFRLQLALEKAQGYEGLVALLPRLREAIEAKKLRAVEKILLAPDAVSVPASNAPTPAIIP
ncbi:hypothetical protein [Comamonas odontotermitis]|uniref:hypothetical protein n=1 Tax=Comamonas odontotermitis TaxID=379895 RepID=UPI001CC81812|nr:hypothetical protein [Comamonas odontotermitis]UBB15852.1 hypothetical protein LAD35_13475 [Comamonas odontotermitis]